MDQEQPDTPSAPPGPVTGPADHSTTPVDHFAQEVASRYDDPSSPMFQPPAIDPAVELLARLGAGGPALELGVGTGRIALPLAARGVPVHGIDLSRAMVERMRAKPGGDRIGVTIGDFATTRAPAPGTYGLVYLVYNTINNLTSQDAQVACFRNAADHLRPGGRFLIEVGVPELRLLPPGQRAVPFRVDDSGYGFDTYDPVTQAMTSHHITVSSGGRAEVRSLPFRYVWPAELDLMARLAGLRPLHRWEDFSGRPFTGESRHHVSVWEKPGA